MKEDSASTTFQKPQEKSLERKLLLQRGRVKEMKKVFLSGYEERDFKTRTALLICIIALVVVPIGAYGIEETSGPPPTLLTGQMGTNTPPVEQPLK